MTEPLKTQSTFDILSWHEEAQPPAKGPRRTAAHVKLRYFGDLDGDSHVLYDMVYDEHGGARFTGVETIHATVAGLSGQLVLRHEGVFNAGRAEATVQTVEGASTGDFATCTGHGDMVSVHGQRYDLTLTLTNQTTPTPPSHKEPSPG